MQSPINFSQQLPEEEKKISQKRERSEKKGKTDSNHLGKRKKPAKESSRKKKKAKTPVKDKKEEKKEGKEEKEKLTLQMDQIESVAKGNVGMEAVPAAIQTDIKKIQELDFQEETIQLTLESFQSLCGKVTRGTRKTKPRLAALPWLRIFSFIFQRLLAKNSDASLKSAKKSALKELKALAEMIGTIPTHMERPTLQAVLPSDYKLTAENSSKNEWDEEKMKETFFDRKKFRKRAIEKSLS